MRKDATAFTKAYAELTNACNACHRAAGRGFISVQVPAVSPFTDQDFADEVAEGRKLATTICGVCHVVPDRPNVPLGMSFSAPSFVDLARRQSFTEATLRQLLSSEHRRVGPAQAMPNPRLNDNQIDDIVAYFDALKAEQKK
jgi:mono/diheme cytochrome c family protein